ncbi:ATP synthase subunit s-like protein isoform X2 [Limulus polyphemus]|uniref:ATP synthase subunit s-like protein isoform X2 n=1 Tax=Limulus polyphemus TaxID=6850 RepID=A0ABM1BUX7_LIMPO|nr:ATP synthase subunit s-like protein isoform X2 [Limulus polyphemus]
MPDTEYLYYCQTSHFVIRIPRGGSKIKKKDKPRKRWMICSAMYLFSRSLKTVVPLCVIRYTTLGFSRLFNENNPQFPRKPEENLTSVFSLFKPRKGIGVDVLSFLHQKWDFSISGFQRWNKRRKEALFLQDQCYIPERHNILGPDLASAHFIVHRGGCVKFVGQDIWLKKDEDDNYDLPSQYKPNMYLEKIDASGIPLAYEGFDNLVNLLHLKSLTLHDSPHLDDWCLDRFHQFRSLEHLDISGCQQVTERGICTLHKLKNLKKLNLTGVSGVKNLELVCLLLEDVLPELRIEGVNYMDTSILGQASPEK